MDKILPSSTRVHAQVHPHVNAHGYAYAHTCFYTQVLPQPLLVLGIAAGASVLLLLPLKETLGLAMA